jgi:hypothetical protein
MLLVMHVPTRAAWICAIVAISAGASASGRLQAPFRGPAMATCSANNLDEDQIDIVRNYGQDPATLLIDGPYGGHVLNDRMFSNEDSVKVDKMLTCLREPCVQNVIAFAPRHAMQWLSPTDCTSPSGNTLRVSLVTKPPEVDSVLWVVKRKINDYSPPLLYGGLSTVDRVIEVARTHFSRLNELYDSSGCGVTVKEPIVRTLEIDANEPITCATFRARNPAEKMLNAYYVGAVGDSFYCQNAVQSEYLNVVLGGSDSETLAHEFGHLLSFTGAHHDNPQNLMFGSGPARKFVLKGQCFRANTGKTSMLRELSLVSHVREQTCSPKNADAACPSMACDGCGENPSERLPCWEDTIQTQNLPPWATKDLEAFRTVLRYLECDECLDGERAAVEKLGGRAHETVMAALSPKFVPERLALAGVEAYVTHQRLAKSPLALPGISGASALTAREYAAFQRSNLLALHQARAAQAAVTLRLKRAEPVIKAEMGDARADVRQAFREALLVLQNF